jgi:hypothetical protein
VNPLILLLFHLPYTIPLHSALSTISTGELIRQQQSHNYEGIHEDETESLTPNANQTVEFLSQSSQPGTAPWILASRAPHAPKKPEDAQFMAYMANIRRQINDSSTSSTPQVSLTGDRVLSIASSVFSQSFSVASISKLWKILSGVVSTQNAL